MTESAEPDPDDSGYNPWWWFSIFYPIASALILGPISLVLGWWWVCIAFTVIGAVVVLIRDPWSYNDKLKIPLLLWNASETLLALCFIIHHLREWLKTLQDAKQ
jgi:hypothetical protein